MKYDEKTKKDCIDAMVRGQLSLKEIGLKFAVSYSTICTWNANLSIEQTKLRARNVYNFQQIMKAKSNEESKSKKEDSTTRH